MIMAIVLGVISILLLWAGIKKLKAEKRLKKQGQKIPESNIQDKGQNQIVFCLFFFMFIGCITGSLFMGIVGSFIFGFTGLGIGIMVAGMLTILGIDLFKPMGKKK
jgi:ABC-type Fe3+ transport system permease subunit